MKYFTIFCITLIVAGLCAMAPAFAQTPQDTIQVSVQDGLNAAIDFANAGGAGVLELVDDGGIYEISQADIMVPLVIKAAAGLANKPQIRPAAGDSLDYFFKVRNDFVLYGLILDGAYADGSGLLNPFGSKRMISVDSSKDPDAPKLRPDCTVLDCELYNVYQNGDVVNDTEGNPVGVSGSSLAGTLWFERTTIANFGDEGFRISEVHKSQFEGDFYHLDSLIIRDCTFANNNAGSAIKLSGDKDSTTPDTYCLLENLTFYNCGTRVVWVRGTAGTVVRNLIIANTRDNPIGGSNSSLVYVDFDGSRVSHIDTFMVASLDSGAVAVPEGDAGAWILDGTGGTSTVLPKTIVGLDPMFADPENMDFTVGNSALSTMGHDGGPLGDRRWASPVSQTVIPVRVQDGLNAAIDFANAGGANVLELVDDGGIYEITQADIMVPMMIKAADGLTNKPQIRPAAGDTLSYFFKVRNDLVLQGLILDGAYADGSGLLNPFTSKRMISVDSSKDPDAPNLRPDCMVLDCELYNVYQNGDAVNDTEGNPVGVSGSSLAGTLRFERTTIANFGDEGFRISEVHKSQFEGDFYHLESLIIRDCTFANNNAGSAIKLSGDKDSTTPDTYCLLENLTFYNCGTRVVWVRGTAGTVVRNLIIANTRDNPIGGSNSSLVYVDFAGSKVSHVDTFMVASLDSGAVAVPEGDAGAWILDGTGGTSTVDASTIFGMDPMFADPENMDFTVGNSALFTLGHDGGPLGDQRWTDTVTSVKDESRTSSVPRSYALAQNFPNPFNPATTIQYTLEKTSEVSLKIFNIRGELIETLVSGSRTAGEHSVLWDASNVASGIYFYQLEADRKVLTKKMMLLK